LKETEEHDRANCCLCSLRARQQGYAETKKEMMEDHIENVYTDNYELCSWRRDNHGMEDTISRIPWVGVAFSKV
jgi:hypothetical protein